MDLMAAHLIVNCVKSRWYSPKGVVKVFFLWTRMPNLDGFSQLKNGWPDFNGRIYFRNAPYSALAVRYDDSITFLLNSIQVFSGQNYHNAWKRPVIIFVFSNLISVRETLRVLHFRIGQTPLWRFFNRILLLLDDEATRNRTSFSLIARKFPIQFFRCIWKAANVDLNVFQSNTSSLTGHDSFLMVNFDIEFGRLGPSYEKGRFIEFDRRLLARCEPLSVMIWFRP